MRLCFVFLFLLSIPAAAEYRMFLLQITSADGTPGAQIPSNLDPDQYRGYHPIKQDEKITYIDTWMCRGNTSEIPACPSPRDPASLTTPTAAATTTPAVLETPPAAPAAPAAPTAPVKPPP